jgi:hypothetical protein
MKGSAPTDVTDRLLSTVRVYADEDAIARDGRGRLDAGFRFKDIHDNLLQVAVDLKLATLLSMIDWRRPPAFRDACQVHTQRAAWWPANASPSNKRDLLSLRLAPTAEAALGKDWLSIRAVAEQGKRTTLWHDDPALAFAVAPGIWFGRTACIGHEGLAYYFVYGSREREWEQSLERAGLKICASGTAAYVQHFKVVGQLAGRLIDQ